MATHIQNPVPVLVTLTSPSAGGKSFLLNYIRDVAKLPCLISTTTRPPRVGEVEGVDYYFISDEESRQIEKNDQFAELAIYRGVRYGVTKKEFLGKLMHGLAFLIVEPSGIDHYVQPAKEFGAKHLKYYINTDPAIRLARFKKRTQDDIIRALENIDSSQESILKLVNSAMDRLVAMLTEETKWFEMCNWDRVLPGTGDAASNIEIILNDVQKLQEHHEEVFQFNKKRRQKGDYEEDTTLIRPEMC